jgi:FKBP12-rapamycin complex-associated protein
MKSCSAGLQEYYFQNLGHLITMVKQHIRNHLPPILQLINDFWNSGPTLQVIIVDLVESIALALEGEFKEHLPTLLPLMLQVFEDTGDRRTATQLRVLRAFAIFGSNLEEYLHLAIPAIVRVIERPEAPLAVRKNAIQTIGILCRKINFADHASRVIHPLSRVLSSGPSELKITAMDTLCGLVSQIGKDYAIFVPMVNKVRVPHPLYDSLVSKLLKGEPLPQEIGFSDL